MELQNTMVHHNTSESSKSNKSIKPKPTDKVCRDSYKDISKYPIPGDPIRYPRVQDANTNQYQYNYKSNFHDIIHLNMQALVPNIELGLYNSHTHDDIETWINNTKAYIKLLNDNIQHKCNKKLKTLNLIKKQAELSDKLDVNTVNTLPDEIINHIYGYLLPETRIKLLLGRYPEYSKTLQKLTNENLKKYLRCIQQTYMNKVFDYNMRFPDRQSCIPKRPDLYLSFSRKQDGIDQLKTLLEAIRNAIPKTEDCNRYFQNYALKLLQSMIYISIYKNKELSKNKKRTTPAAPVAPTA